MSQIYNIQRRKKLFNFNASLVLIIINVLVFILILFAQFIFPNLIDYVALKPSNVINASNINYGFYLWTFLTSMFMHAGFFHLFANMFSLLFVGNLVERIIGKKRFVSFYLLAGLFAGMLFVLVSLFFSSDFNTYAVGASGAIFGIVGLLMILTPNLPVYIMFIPIPIKMKYAAPAMLILLWVVSSLANIPVGNTAHLGGFIFGLAYGIYLKRKYKKKAAYISKIFS